MLEARAEELYHTSFSMDEASVRRVADAVAHFTRDMLELRCSPTTVAHTLRDDPFRACSFAELIVHDGHHTFSGYVGQSAYERRCMEEMRTQIERGVDVLSDHAASYMLLLRSLSEILCHQVASVDDAIDLKELVVHPEPTRCYFVQLCLNREMRVVDTSECVAAATLDQPQVVVGGLARALSVALESAMDRWLVACEDAINVHVLAGASSKTPLLPCDVRRAGALRKRLRRSLCDHIAMVGLFRRSRVDHPALEEHAGELNDRFIELLLGAQLGGDTAARCEERRRAQLEALDQLARLLQSSSSDSAMDVIREHGVAIVSTLNSPPRVLRRRAGFAICDLEVNKLAMIVHGHGSRELLAKQLDVWRRCVGEATLASVLAMVERSVELVKQWKLPSNGFLPTMRAIDVPLPTWTDDGAARAGLGVAREAMAMQADADADSASCLPPAVESALRMTSLLWELTGYEATREVYFEIGRVRGGYLHDVVINQSVTAEHALSSLVMYKQQIAVGANFRTADAQIREFGGSEFESPLRAAACHLSDVSLGEFLAVASDLSPMHHAQRWRIVDRVGGLLGSSEFARFVGRSAAVVGIALEAALPILLAMRSEIGLSPVARSSPARDFLLTIGRVRRATRDDTAPLVLTHEDLATSAVPRAHERMRLLQESSGGHVSFGRMSRGAGAVHNHGARRVWSIDPAFLRDLLFEPVEVVG